MDHDAYRAGTALVMCDRTDRRAALTAALRRDGYLVLDAHAVVPVPNGGQTRRLPAAVPDVAIVDVATADAARQRLRQLASGYPGLPTVLVVSPATQLNLRSLDHGATVFYTPVDMDMLLAAVDRLVSRRAVG